MSPTNEATLNQETDPLAPLEHLVQWLVGATVHVALGVLLGLLAARVMRRRHLHWSWAAGAFALVVLVRAVLAGSAATLGVAALTSVIAHRQAVPESAELCARLTGSRGAWRTSVSSDGRSTRTRVSEHLVGPEEVMSLPRGCAAVIRLSSPRSASIARMHSPELP